MSRKSVRKKKQLRKQKIRCAVYGGVCALCLAGGMLLRRNAAGILLFGVAAAALFFCANAWFRWVKRGARNLIGAAAVAISAAVLVLFFGGVGGRLFPAGTTSLDRTDLQGLSSLTGIGRMRSLQRLDARDGGFDGTDTLYECSQLRLADLRGNQLTLQEEIRLKNELPDCEFLWEVPLAAGMVSEGAPRVSLSQADASSWEEVCSCLSLFTALEEVDLTGVSLPLEEYIWIERENPGIAFSWQADIDGAKVGNDYTDLTLIQKRTVEEIEKILSCLPGVKNLDLSAQEYDLESLMRLTRDFPQVQIRWKSRISGMEFAFDHEQLNLTGREVDMETLVFLAENMPSLREISVYDSGLTQEELGKFAMDHPKLTVLRDVEIGGKQLDRNAAHLDFSGQTVQYDELASALSALTQIQSVDLTDCSLTETEKRQLCARYPEIQFVWTTEIYGQEVSTTQTKLKLRGAQIASAEELISVLQCFRDLEYVDLTDCSLSNEDLARVREMFPEKGVVWTLHIGIYTVRTNATAFSTFHVGTGTEPYYTSEEFSVLKYCNRMLALDIGHNHVDDLSWLEEMPQLKVLILADNKISDITSLGKLTNLEYLELFVNTIRDVTPLANLTNLIDLNLGFNNFSDITPLMGLTGLERLWLTNNMISYQDQRRLAETLTNTHCDFNSETAVAGGWRVHQRYNIIYEMFKNGYYIDWDGNVLK